MKQIGMRVIVRAWNAEGYQRDILLADQQQVRMTDGRIKGGRNGSIIDPKAFPEMTHFEVILENIYE